MEGSERVASHGPQSAGIDLSRFETCSIAQSDRAFPVRTGVHIDDPDYVDDDRAIGAEEHLRIERFLEVLTVTSGKRVTRPMGSAK
jgi:hypothetical protein